MMFSCTSVVSAADGRGPDGKGLAGPVRAVVATVPAVSHAEELAHASGRVFPPSPAGI
jgi:hypothetical protein